MRKLDVNDEKVVSAIHELIKSCGGDPDSFEGDLITQQFQNSLKFIVDGHDIGQLKLITRAFKEMRYAYNIFNKYPVGYRISIFGSARTAEDHPDYITAGNFSHAITKHGWVCITGAAEGIMKAGLEGQKPGLPFGLSIRLPFEIPVNEFIAGGPKLISFRYFFTRKLMFMSHSDAVAVFPGGFGTFDELFEILTLIQTGRNNIIPVVLLEGESGVYWHYWQKYINKNLLASGRIDPEDERLFYIAESVEDGVQHILKFYRRYHSSRYVKDNFVIRLTKPINEQYLDLLNQKYFKLVKSGRIKISGPLKEEDDHLELPRLVFHHTRCDYGLLRIMIDQINDFI